jgi:hypothetical protein
MGEATWEGHTARYARRAVLGRRLPVTPMGGRRSCGARALTRQASTDPHHCEDGGRPAGERPDDTSLDAPPSPSPLRAIAGLPRGVVLTETCGAAKSCRRRAGGPAPAEEGQLRFTGVPPSLADFATA